MFVAVLLATACETGDATQIVVNVTSRVATYERVQVAVFIDGAPAADVLLGEGQPVATPFSFTLVPSGDLSARRAIRVVGEVGAESDIGEFPDARFVEGETTFVTINLDGEIDPPIDGGTDAGDDASDTGDAADASDAGVCIPGATECESDSVLASCVEGRRVRTPCVDLIIEEDGTRATCIGASCTLICEAGRLDCNDDLSDGCEFTGEVCTGPPIDLLLLVDNSISMEEEQAKLASELARVVSVFATGDLDGDGTPDLAPVESLNLGVVTTDMGSGGFDVVTCDEPNRGDDGLLLGRGGDGPGCSGMYPRFLNFRPGETSEMSFVNDAACLVSTGTDGCGFEQPLEAILKAVTPRASIVRFNDDEEPGHGDGRNEGFLREDAVLVIIALTDENDCSASDLELYNIGSVRYPGQPNLRCFAYPEALHPVSRFADGLVAVRPPERLVFASIAGIPTGAAGEDPDEILAHPDMTERVNAEMTQLRPACASGSGSASPARRLVRLGQRLEVRGVRTTFHSICEDSFVPAINAIVMMALEPLR